jgi:SAM-dependent MidA family methyltransferase
MSWQEAMRTALYGPAGFYTRGEPPARHFRTSANTSARYGEAFSGLLRAVDLALGRPARLDLVDIGSGRGELLGHVLAAAGAEPELARRITARAVEVAPRPAGLDPRISWCSSLPGRVTGLVIASEWLDNVPLDVAELTEAGPRLVLVDPASGGERHGPAPSLPDLAWLASWWPLGEPGERAEIGRPRCEAWAAVIRRITRGVAVAADYGHTKAARPPCGTLTGYLAGRAVPAVPDGSRDITAHVALDACAAAGRAAGAGATLLTTQREALRGLGIEGRQPVPALAGTDPRRYLQELCLASEEAELIDEGGLGGFGWLVQAVGMELPPGLAALARPVPVTA